MRLNPADAIVLASQISYFKKEGTMDEALSLLLELNPLQAIYVAYAYALEEDVLLGGTEIGVMVTAIAQEMNKGEE